MMRLSAIYAELGIKLYQPRVFNAQSRTNFFNNRVRLLVASLDHEVTPYDMILIQRIVQSEWDLLKQDARMHKGEELTPWAERNRAWQENRLRLSLRALCKYPAQVPPAKRKEGELSEFEEMLLRLREQDAQGMAP